MTCSRTGWRTAGGLLLVLAASWVCEARTQEPADNTADGIAQLAKQVRALQAAGKNRDALPLAKRLAQAAPAVLGADSTQSATHLYLAAQVHRDAGVPAQAESLFLRSLAIREAKLGKDHLEVATILSSMGWLYFNNGQPAKAVPVFQRNLQILEARLGQDHPSVATSLNGLAYSYNRLGQHARAELLALRSLAIAEAKLGKDHLTVADSLGNLGHAYSGQGQYAKAEPPYLRYLAIREAKLGKDHPYVASSLESLAALYRNMGEPARAVPLAQRNLAIREAKQGKDHPETIQSLNNLASLYSSQGQYALAEPLYARALASREARLGKDHLDVAQSYASLAWLYYGMGQYARAEPLFLRSLQINEAKLGKDHPLVAKSLNALTGLYQIMGQHAKAEPLIRRSLAIGEAKLAKDDLTLAQSLRSLGHLYRSQGQYAKAEPLFLRDVQIHEAKLGKDHPEVAHCLNTLTLLYWNMGEYAKALPVALRAVAIREAKLGMEHPLLVHSLNNLAALYEASDRTAQAADYTERARRVIRRHAALTLPFLTQREQDDFLRRLNQGAYHRALSLGVRHAADQDLAARSATWLLNGKAVVQQTSAEAILLARDSRDPATADLARRLADTRRQLARLTLTTPEPEQEAVNQHQLRDLTAQEQELAKQLHKAGSRAATTDPWVEHGQLLQALPPDAALIDIARFTVDDGKATGPQPKQKTAHYAAWISRAGQAVQVVDLGPAAEIDSNVAKVRQRLAAASRTIRQQGEPDAEADVREPLEALAKRVLHPLLPHVGKAERWIISPDGNLWLVPWAALPLPGGKYAIEEHPISYVVSGRDLVNTAVQAKVQPTAPLVLADPDFDLGLDQVAMATRKLLQDRQDLDQTRGLSDALKLGHVQRLPGTASEADRIRPGLEKYAGTAARVRTDDLALAGLVQAARGPKVLVLSTHGFFLPDQEIARSERDSGPGDEARRPALKVENPLLRCGLLFAGCNKVDTARSGAETGVLTGLQIVGCDLRGTELVVLSACDTGLGDVRNGEGVAGLRQAFQLAGAHSVVATLWQIPDQQSAQLMTRFFDNLAAGQRKSDALRNAQLALIKARRDKNAVAHPFFWAAFTLTGP